MGWLYIEVTLNICPPLIWCPFNADCSRDALGCNKRCDLCDHRGDRQNVTLSLMFSHAFSIQRPSVHPAQTVKHCCKQLYCVRQGNSCYNQHRSCFRGPFMFVLKNSDKICRFGEYVFIYSCMRVCIVAYWGSTTPAPLHDPALRSRGCRLGQAPVTLQGKNMVNVKSLPH